MLCARPRQLSLIPSRATPSLNLSDESWNGRRNGASAVALRGRHIQWQRRPAPQIAPSIGRRHRRCVFLFPRTWRQNAGAGRGGSPRRTSRAEDGTPECTIHELEDDSNAPRDVFRHSRSKAQGRGTGGRAPRCRARSGAAGAQRLR